MHATVHHAARGIITVVLRILFSTYHKYLSSDSPLLLTVGAAERRAENMPAALSIDSSLHGIETPA